MSITIKYPESDAVPFEQLPTGSTFIHDGNLCVKYTPDLAYVMRQNQTVHIRGTESVKEVSLEIIVR